MKKNQNSIYELYIYSGTSKYWKAKWLVKFVRYNPPIQWKLDRTNLYYNHWNQGYELKNLDTTKPPYL